MKIRQEVLGECEISRAPATGDRFPSKLERILLRLRGKQRRHGALLTVLPESLITSSSYLSCDGSDVLHGTASETRRILIVNHRADRKFRLSAPQSFRRYIDGARVYGRGNYERIDELRLS